MANKIHFKFFGISAQAEGAPAIKSMERLVCIGMVAMIILGALAGTGFSAYVLSLLHKLFSK